MARILFGWDSGAGTGYIDRLLLVAHALAAEGHEPIFAIRDLVTPAQKLRNVAWPVFQSPIAVGKLDPISPSFNPNCFSDLLSVANFTDAIELGRLMQAWELLFHVSKPDLIIGEYIPLLSLAAYGRIPVLAMGHGYLLPPAELPQFPLFDYKRPLVAPQETMLQVVQTMQQQRGAPVPPTLPRAVSGDLNLVIAYSVTDPYERMRAQPPIGPLEAYAPAPPPAQPRFYAYLDAEYRALQMLVNALVEARLPGSVYIKRLTPQLRQFLTERGIQVLDRPPPLEQAVREASLVIHHGGMATTSAALGLGRPQMLWPAVADQATTARQIHRLGAANTTAALHATTTEAARAMQNWTTDANAMARAQEIAAQLHARGEGNSLGRVVEGARQLLARGRP